MKHTHLISHAIRLGGLAAILSFSAPVSASALSDLAAQMPAGSWAELSTNGLTDELLSQPENPASNILGFSDNAVWDPVSKSFLFLGGPHGAPKKFIRYRESTNSWSTLPVFSSNATHGYDHNAIDPSRREFYHRRHSSADMWRFNIDNETWSPMPDLDASGYIGVAGGMEYFPELGSSGMLVLARGGANRLHKFDFSKNSWSNQPNGSMGNYHNFAEYNPVHKLVIFGGGNNSAGERSKDVYAIDGNGNVSTKNNAPIFLGIHETVLTVDPSTGDYLVFNSAKKFYVYDVVSDSWSLQSGQPPIFDQVQSVVVGGIVAAPIPEYGVVMFLKALGPKVYLYKHGDGPSTPVDNIPPAAPDNLGVN